LEGYNPLVIFGFAGKEMDGKTIHDMPPQSKMGWENIGIRGFRPHISEIKYFPQHFHDLSYRLS